MEKNGEKKVKQGWILNGTTTIKRYDTNNLRFKVGQRVECRIGEKDWAVGRITKLLDEDDETGKVFPYIVRLEGSASRCGGITVPMDADYCCKEVAESTKTTTKQCGGRTFIVVAEQKDARNKVEYVD